MKTDRNSMQNDSRPYVFPLSENISLPVLNVSKFERIRNNRICLYRGEQTLAANSSVFYPNRNDANIHTSLKTQSTNIFKPSKEDVNFRKKKKIYSLLDVDPTWAGYFRHLERRKIASSSSYRTSQSWHRFQFKTNAWLANSHNDPSARRHVLKLNKPQPKLPIRLFVTFFFSVSWMNK